MFQPKSSTQGTNAGYTAPLTTPTDLGQNAVREIAGAPNILRRASRANLPNDRRYCGTLRKIGGATLRSIGHIGRLQRVEDNDAEFITPADMLAELREDNGQLVASVAISPQRA